LPAITLALLVFGCSVSKEFDPIPAGLDTTKVPRETIEMTAEHFHFALEGLHVKQGTLLTLKIKSIDGTHGFSLGDFGIDIRLEEGVTNTVELHLRKKVNPASAVHTFVGSPFRDEGDIARGVAAMFVVRVTACSLIPPGYRWSASCDRIPILAKNFL
jgi:hypothetical protein